MDETRRNEILNKAYRNIEAVDVVLSEPHVSPPMSWQPSQADQNGENRQNDHREPAPQRRSSSTVELINLRNQLGAQEARHMADKATISECLDALAEELGSAAGQLQKQLDELKALVKELQNEVGLLRVSASMANEDARSRVTTPRRKSGSRSPFPEQPADEQRH